MASDLIKRDSIRADVCLYMGANAYLNDTALDVLKMIDKWLCEAEAVDASPVRHGEWIKAHGMLPPEFFGKHKCSLCGHFALSWRIGHEELSNYCPNCGAKMDGGKT